MQRIRFFDIAKGIAILAVILGHSAIEANVFIPHHTAQLVVAVCFSFHMPLFFILSGYFMHPERSFRWAKEVRQLLCTYAVTGVAVLVGVTCMSTINHEGRAYMLRRWGEAVLYGSGDISDRTLWPVELRIGAIWFLLALFLGASVAACLRQIAVYAGLGGVQLYDRLYFRPIRVVALELAVGYVRGRVRICRLLGEAV